jgi:hypothetical protein
MSDQTHNVTLGLTRKSLEAIKIHACPNCGAPGVYRNDQRTLDSWPGCYSPTMHSQPVGATCPNCKMPRSKDKNLGELAASMPKWIWMCVLGFKWALIQFKALTS